MSDESTSNIFQNPIIVALLTGTLTAGGTTAIHTVGNDETIVDNVNIQQCQPFITHGKNHERLDQQLLQINNQIKLQREHEAELRKLKDECN